MFMRFYEVVVIVGSEVSSSRVEEKVGEYVKIVKEHSGEVSKTEFCGLRTLAYQIGKCKKGYYVLLNIKVDPKAVKDLEHSMRMDEEVIRFLVVKVEELDNNPSFLMNKGYRDAAN
jgi:small subunit ribosomal protein S6